MYTKDLLEDYDNYEYSNKSFFKQIEKNVQVSFNVFELFYYLCIIVKHWNIK